MGVSFSVTPQNSEGYGLIHNHSKPSSITKFTCNSLANKARYFLKQNVITNENCGSNAHMNLSLPIIVYKRNALPYISSRDVLIPYITLARNNSTQKGHISSNNF